MMVKRPFPYHTPILWYMLVLLGLSAGQKSFASQDPSAPLPAPRDGHDSTDSGSDGRLFETIYRDFHKTYRLGPGDEVAVHVLKQPEYSLEKTRVNPVGRIYHPLLGEVQVAGMSLDQLATNLTVALSEYLIGPKVTVSLLEAQSGKVGVLGEVVHPGIIIMSRPMTVLDAISISGGFLDTANKSNISLIRQRDDGNFRTTRVNLKSVLQGKADAEANVKLRAGDTLIVEGNTRKTIAHITTLIGFAQFIAVVGLAR
jgi:polysaccharide export outer membrane protein